MKAGRESQDVETVHQAVLILAPCTGMSKPSCTFVLDRSCTMVTRRLILVREFMEGCKNEGGN